MIREDQEKLLEWIHNDAKAIALFIEPVGRGEYLDYNRLKANKKAYYDHLFKD